MTKRRWEPSLTRRVLSALLLAFVTVWAVLVTVDFLTFKFLTDERLTLHAASGALAEALSGVDETGAALIARATEIQFNHARHDGGPKGIEDMLFRVSRPDGRVVYDSPGLKNFASPSIKEGTTEVMGKTYSIAVTETAQWRIVLLEPVVPDALALRLLIQGLVQPMLIALPFLLLSLWWAVRRGLQPLQTLVATVQARDSRDVSALSMDMRYAELRPIVIALNELLARARAGIQRERKFVQDAAHELRTPMAVVSAQAHALTSASDLPAQAAAKAALERAVARASHLVHQLLTLARLDGLSTQALRVVDLVALTRDIVIDLTPLADARGIEITLQSPETLPALLFAEAWPSILENLLGNALKYCHPKARVEVSLAIRGDLVWLSVQDDGPGMSGDELAHAFVRFRRGRESVSTGAGLGLSIVQDAARCLGGHAQVQAGICGRGLSVVVSFPLRGAPNKADGNIADVAGDG